MTWLYGVLGLALGLAIGWAMHAHVSRAIEAENRELRHGLRYVRGVCVRSSARGLTRYIDRLLGDEAA